MKMFTVSEFQALLKDPNWEHERHHELVGEDLVNREFWNHETDEEDGIRATVVEGERSVISVLGDLKITFTEQFEYDECEPNSIIDGDQHLSFEGFWVVGKDDKRLEPFDLIDDIIDRDAFSEMDYDFLEIDVVDEVDVDESNEEDTHTIRVSYLPDIKFTGKLVASHTYDVMTGRWTELKFYQTTSGKFVCHAVRRTQWQDEEEFFQGEVCDTLEQAHSFFKSYKGASVPGNEISDLFVL